MAQVYDLEEMFSYDGWDGLYAILHGASYDDVVAMLIAGGYEDVFEVDGDAIYVCGCYADESPVIEFEDGIVARWYRQGCFD